MSLLKKARDVYVVNQVNRIKLPTFEPSTIVRLALVFKGKVQKVGFRLEIFKLAKRLQLTGWVKNLEDKNVEAEIQGENEKIVFLIEFMKSLKRATVRDVSIIDIPTVDNDKEFTIIK